MKFNFKIKKISRFEATTLVQSYHYSKVMPQLTKYFLGCFLDDELASIQIVANNLDTGNEVTKNLSIMNYAMKTYGPFDTGSDKNTYNDYHIWNKNNEIVSYKRDIGLEIFEEELLITNKKYETLLFDYRMSQEIIIEDDGQNQSWKKLKLYYSVF